LRSVDVFRLYLLGTLDLEQPNGKQLLTTLAEHGTARSLHRVEIEGREAQDLAKKIRDLHAYMSSGEPPFDENALAGLGAKLYDAIVQGPVRTLLAKAPSATDAKPLPLEIVVEDTTIAGWPWEFLHDTQNGYLCRRYYPISRSAFNLSRLTEPRPSTDPVRILFVLGATRRDPEADIEEQLHRHKALFAKLEHGNVAKVEVKEAAHPRDIIAAANPGAFDIFHFFGHAGFDYGRKEGYLRFSTNDDKDYRYYANDFADFLLGRDFRLVFLNACETAVAASDRDPARSALAAAILERGIPAVIATQFLMPDNSAHFFSELIYEKLSSGLSLRQAMRDGRESMKFGEKVRHPDWGIPVLYAAYPELVIFPKNRNSPAASAVRGGRTPKR